MLSFKNLPLEREVFRSRALQIKTSCTVVIKISLVSEDAQNGCHIAGILDYYPGELYPCIESKPD